MATLKGIWVFNDTIGIYSVPFGREYKWNVDFTLPDYDNAVCNGFFRYNSMDGIASVLGYAYGESDSFVNVYATDSDMDADAGWRTQYKTVDFGTTEQTVGDTFYTWLTANATQQATEETSGVTVEYNGSVVATVEGGNTATLPIKDKKMKSDIVITVPESSGEVLPEYSEAEDFAVFVESEDEGELTIGYSVSQDVKLSNGVHRLGVIAYEDSPLPTEVSTEAKMTALLTSGEVGGVYKYTGTTGTYENGALYVLEEEAVSEATVTISLTNPSYKNYFYACNIYDDYEGTNKIGEITSADGSTTVQTSTGKLRVELGASGVIAAGTATTSGGVTADGVDEDMSVANFKFLVTDDGTITIDGTSYAD